MEDPQWEGMREAVANNRVLMGLDPQPMHETHNWHELALEATKLAISALNTVLTDAMNIHASAEKLAQAAELMGHAADKRNPLPEPEPETPHAPANETG